MTRLLIALLFAPMVAFAQYPTKPVRMIIPFAPGGASDFVGRIMQPKMAELLGQQIVIENKAGAAGNIGAEAAAKSAPDGYTIFLGNVGSVAINPGVYPKLSINPLKDFIAIGQVVDVPSVLIVHPSMPANTVKEVVAYAKANQGKLNFASPGSGSLDRLEMELFRNLEKLDMVLGELRGPMREETEQWLNRICMDLPTQHATAAEAHNRLMLTKAFDKSARLKRPIPLPIDGE